MDVWMDRIDEHHARDLLTMARGEHAKVECAEVVPNENVGSRNRSAGEQALQFVGNIRAAARLIGRVAPTETSAIVGTDAGKCADLRLNQLPNNRGVVWASLHNNGGTPRARTVDVKAEPADVNEFARGRVAMAFPLRHRELKHCAGSNN